MAEFRRASSRRTRIALAVAVAVGSLVFVLPAASAAAYPPLPLAFDGRMLSNLSAPDLTPGSSGTLHFQVADPLAFGAMSAIVLTLDVYAFNAFPGNATSSVAASGTPLLVTPTSSATVANVSLGSLAPGSSVDGSVGVATAAGTPSGTYAVRTALSFTSGGTSYRLESRGWFTAAQWAAATQLPGGNLTVNLTALGVSGVSPETAILVSSSNWDWALGLILGAGIVLVGAGAFVYFRRESKSSSGAR